MQTTERTENQELSAYPVRLVVKPIIRKKNATMELTQSIDSFHGADDRKDKLKSNKGTLRRNQKKLELQPTF